MFMLSFRCRFTWCWVPAGLLLFNTKDLKYFRRKQGVLYPDNLFWRDVSPAKCLWWCFIGWMLQALQLCMQEFSGSHKAIQNSLALLLCFYKIIISFNDPWGVLPWKQMSPTTGPTSELVLRWPLCQTECILYRLALKSCMSLVHSDSASSSGSSGLCRCLLWYNVCGNLYFGLLISVAADAYHCDLRKLIKGSALPACCVVQCSFPSSERHFSFSFALTQDKKRFDFCVFSFLSWSSWTKKLWFQGL